MRPTHSFTNTVEGASRYASPLANLILLIFKHEQTQEPGCRKTRTPIVEHSKKEQAMKRDFGRSQQSGRPCSCIAIGPAVSQMSACKRSL